MRTVLHSELEDDHEKGEVGYSMIILKLSSRVTEARVRSIEYPVDRAYGARSGFSVPTGAVTQSADVIVSDADSIYERAKEAGAKIVIEVRDEDYGGRGFGYYDLEGHLWNFGT